MKPADTFVMKQRKYYFKYMFFILFGCSLFSVFFRWIWSQQRTSVLDDDRLSQLLMSCISLNSFWMFSFADIICVSEFRIVLLIPLCNGWDVNERLIVTRFLLQELKISCIIYNSAKATEKWSNCANVDQRQAISGTLTKTIGSELTIKIDISDQRCRTSTKEGKVRIKVNFMKHYYFTT